jgi:hypothetical protein
MEVDSTTAVMWLAVSFVLLVRHNDVLALNVILPAFVVINAIETAGGKFQSDMPI